MPRLTAKLKSARQTALENGIVTVNEPETIYAGLVRAGFAWDAKSQTWAKTQRPIRADGTASVSMFSDDNNLPSGIYRLRVMGHPDDIERLVNEMREKLDIFEVSDQYPNRKGGGVRVYLSGKLPKTQLRGRASKGR